MKIGLQMYTVKNSFARDPFGTLEKVAEAGYKYIEMANHKADQTTGTGFGTDAVQLRAKCEKVGITILGSHFIPAVHEQMFERFYDDPAKTQPTIDYFASVGAKYLSLPIDYFPSKRTLLDHCAIYNRLGERCAAAGLKLLYHNHYHDFQRFDGEFILDIMMANTDPALLGIELDAYWTFRGCVDPAEKIRQYGERIAIIHEKDYPLSEIKHLNVWDAVDPDVPLDDDSFHATIIPEQFIEVGDGVIKIQDVIDAGNEWGVEYILVEQDATKLDEIESINRSMSNFRKMRGLEF